MTASDKNQLEVLESKISDYQKQILIKRTILKVEIESENESMVELLQNEITILKEKILFSQGELRKVYLRLGNRKIIPVEKQPLKTGV